MKFDFVIGNPPYQGENHQQIYPDFYVSAQECASCVEMIFPIGWQEPKNANNLRKLNNPQIKEDCQIVFIDNEHNVFSKDVTGAEWTNIILWKEGYNNQLNGLQRVLTDGHDEQILHLDYDKSQIQKPAEIIALSECVINYGGFNSIASISFIA